MQLTSQRKAKLVWHCRRGMLELDLIFERFLKHHLDTLTVEQFVAFEHLLTYPDPDLFAWLMGYDEPTNKESVEIVNFIRFNGKVR